MDLTTLESWGGYHGLPESVLQRQLRVARLRRLVASGQYKVNFEALADALIEQNALKRLS